MCIYWFCILSIKILAVPQLPSAIASPWFTQHRLTDAPWAFQAYCHARALHLALPQVWDALQWDSPFSCLLKIFAEISPLQWEHPKPPYLQFLHPVSAPDPLFVIYFFFPYSIYHLLTQCITYLTYCLASSLV